MRAAQFQCFPKWNDWLLYCPSQHFPLLDRTWMQQACSDCAEQNEQTKLWIMMFALHRMMKVNTNMSLLGFSLIRHVHLVNHWHLKHTAKPDWQCNMRSTLLTLKGANIREWENTSADENTGRLTTWVSNCWLTPLLTLWAEDLPDLNLSYLSQRCERN